jgi:hypothetical protein
MCSHLINVLCQLQWHINITITILDIIRRPVFIPSSSQLYIFIITYLLYIIDLLGLLIRSQWKLNREKYRPKNTLDQQNTIFLYPHGEEIVRK